MPHQNTVFRQLTKFISWGVLHRLIGEHEADCRVRRLSTEGQLLAMIFGQLAGVRSLRELESQLESHAPRLYHAGLSRVRRSTLMPTPTGRPRCLPNCLRRWSVRCDASSAAASGRRFI